ncbi:MAG: SGNH/GDSL hydrolase family protein [Williamsia sp.]|nr:SGNH/GDSL hydrolase family protein [Williamsia sp.]
MITKLFLLCLFVFIAILILILNNKSVAGSSYTYLALGDSYTIGENVALFENYPYQTVQLLRKSGYNMGAPEIIAKTGWTSKELKEGIRNTYLQSSYYFVSLLVGVNDQYRGEDPEEYRMVFEHLLQQAIGLTGNRKERVFVLSIPDWSATPFAEGKDRSFIKEQIDRFNQVNKELAQRHGIAYLYITDGTREAGINNKLLASDGLHYSRKEYANWAGLLAEHMMRTLA